ncbi:unnamed protein product [Closterium sp. NIES-65]|nr:unnamed protein product [Closterium sp. NIES-65]
MAEPWLAAAAAVEAVKDRGSQWRVGRGSRQVGMGEKSETVENVCLVSRHPSPPANPFFPPVSFIYIPLSHPILNPPSSSLTIAPTIVLILPSRDSLCPPFLIPHVPPHNLAQHPPPPHSSNRAVPFIPSCYAPSYITPCTSQLSLPLTHPPPLPSFTSPFAPPPSHHSHRTIRHHVSLPPTSPNLPLHAPIALLSCSYFCPPVLSAPPPYLRARCLQQPLRPGGMASQGHRQNQDGCIVMIGPPSWKVFSARPKSGGQSGCVGWAEIIDDAWGGDYGGCVGCCPWVERVEWPGAVGKLDIGKCLPICAVCPFRPFLSPSLPPHLPPTQPPALNPHLLIPHLLLCHGLPSLCRGRTVRPHSSTVEAADVAEVRERLQAKLGEAGLLGASWWCLRSDEQRKEEVHSE